MPSIKITALVLHASPYSFINDETHERVSGVKIHYLHTDTVEPIQDERTKGYPVASTSLPIEEADNILLVPAYYDLECEIRFHKNSMMIKPLSAKYASPLLIPGANNTDEHLSASVTDMSNEQAKSMNARKQDSHTKPKAV